MANLKTSQLQNKPVPDASDLFRYGLDKNITWSQILSALGLSENNEVFISPNSSTYVPLFNVAAQMKVSIDYYFIRGTRRRMEQIQIMSGDYTTIALILSTGFKTFPDNDSETCGITLSAEIISGIVNLIITSDNSDSELGVMIYKTTFNG